MIKINKLNEIIGDKITDIQKRENVLVKNQIDTNDKNKALKKRVGLLKSMKEEKIRRENEQMAKRIIEK